MSLFFSHYKDKALAASLIKNQPPFLKPFL
jgi:hypothetical protein